MSAERTEVSKANPTIKKIVGATIGAGWKGRRVVVIAADYAWEHTRYIDDQVQVWDVYLASMSAHASVLRPTYGGPPVVYSAPQSGHALVLHERFMGKDVGIEIVVPDTALDPAVLEIAIDALLSSNPKAAVAVLSELGPAAGIAMAVAEARSKTRSKAAGGAPATRNARRSAAQLDREIEAVTGRRPR